jgi:hypothetical protein
LNSTGWWTLHYDWGVKSVFSVAQIYFNFDGTFGYLAGANEGTWTEVDGTIIWRFKQTQEKESTVYSGHINRDVMSGAMFSSAGEKGQWYAVKKGAKLYLNKDNSKLPYLMDKQANLKLDPTGKPVADTANATGNL